MSEEHYKALSEAQAKTIEGLEKELEAQKEQWIIGHCLNCDKLQATIETLMGAFIKAIQDEPEMPGGMPDDMWRAIQNDRDACNVAIQTTIKLTKDGILERFTQPPAKKGKTDE